MSFNLYLLLFGILGFWTIMNFFSSSLKKRGIEIVGFTLLWRTKKFTKTIDSLSKKFGRLWDYFAKIGIAVSLGGSVLVVYLLYSKILQMLEDAEPQKALTLAIPGKTIPLWYGLIGIVVLVIVHEFSHGIIARRENIPLKSVGVGLLIALPLAFTEPEEEAMKKASSWSRIKVYAAGSMANFITGLTALLLITACSSLIVGNGIVVNEVQEGMPAEGILEKGMIVHSVNGIEFNNPSEFSEIMDEFKPGKTIVLGTDKGEKEITLTENPDDPGKGYIGIYLKTYLTTTYGDLFLPIYFSFYWIFALNIGIGLMNLLPIAPVLDGGKIAKEFIDMRFSTNISNAICTVLALFSISLILLNFFPKILTIL